MEKLHAKTHSLFEAIECLLNKLTRARESKPLKAFEIQILVFFPMRIFFHHFHILLIVKREFHNVFIVRGGKSVRRNFLIAPVYRLIQESRRHLTYILRILLSVLGKFSSASLSQDSRPSDVRSQNQSREFFSSSFPFKHTNKH